MTASGLLRQPQSDVLLAIHQIEEKTSEDNGRSHDADEDCD